VKSELKMTLFLLITTTACTLLLAGANLAYQRASAIFSVRLYATILDLFEIPLENDEVETVFAENFETISVGGGVFYRSTQKNPGTMVFKSEGPGLWSRVDLLMAVNPDRESLYGLRVISQAETPGLGGRIAEEGFQAAFAGMDIRPTIRVVKFAMAGNEVDAISGATRTSTAVEKILNQGIQNLDRAVPLEEQ
jgi:Na(+)-translocating NADH:ubiquinone oxidoreductase C subunit